MTPFHCLSNLTEPYIIYSIYGSVKFERQMGGFTGKSCQNLTLASIPFEPRRLTTRMQCYAILLLWPALQTTRGLACHLAVVCKLGNRKTPSCSYGQGHRRPVKAHWTVDSIFFTVFEVFCFVHSTRCLYIGLSPTSQLCIYINERAGLLPSCNSQLERASGPAVLAIAVN